tara:strand:- start:291 stop:425 length:135 start_codon:yes stop_codon:yes gene_type:complete
MDNASTKKIGRIQKRGQTTMPGTKNMKAWLSEPIMKTKWATEIC